MKKDIADLDTHFEKKYATKKDLVAMEKRFGEKFATKADLENAIANSKDEVLEKMQEMVTDIKSYFFELIDPVMNEVQAGREEREIVAHRLSNHEDRIKRLEAN